MAGAGAARYENPALRYYAADSRGGILPRPTPTPAGDKPPRYISPPFWIRPHTGVRWGAAVPDWRGQPLAGPPPKPGSVILAGSRRSSNSESLNEVISRATSRTVRPDLNASFEISAAAS